MTGYVDNVIQPAHEPKVSVIIAAGTEAGGHCGEIGTLVLVPEVLEALEAIGSAIPVLAAGGIAGPGSIGDSYLVNEEEVHS